MNNRRIDLLDSFRFLAVLPVLLYHFTFEWKSRTPYGNYFGDLFRYGYFGVAFFFIISGFVISYTLENTASLSSFWKHRFIRLFPALLLCSLISYAAALFLDNRPPAPGSLLSPNLPLPQPASRSPLDTVAPLFPNARPIKNFLPTLTLTNPNIWNSLTNIRNSLIRMTRPSAPDPHFAWINGSYWSLWVEIQFYLVAAFFYFLDKKNFFRNILLMALLLNIIKGMPSFLLNGRWRGNFSPGWVDFLSGWNYTNAVFNIDYYILWFAAGIIFFYLYKWRHAPQDIHARGNPSVTDNPIGRKPPRPLNILLGIIVLIQLSRDTVYKPGILHLVMAALFLMMIYTGKYLSFLDNRLFRRIGVVSYSVYLVHEVAGVLLIHRYGGLLGKWSPFAPFIMIVLVIGFAECSYRFYERKMAVLLKTILTAP